jgi:hypothetical protein
MDAEVSQKQKAKNKNAKHKGESKLVTKTF